MLQAIAALCAVLVTGNTPFDHSDFDRLLKAHVVDGKVDYDAFARAPGFPRYLERLAQARPETLSAKEQLAYWINVYNAYTIQLVNAHGERKSIRSITEPWKQDIVRAGGRTMSLDHVEHEIIRKRFREPRIHFALVCAAVSCPPLRPEAYTGERLDAQLDDQARIFVARSPEKNRVDVAFATAHLSPIFVWFKDDFGPDLGRFLARYFPDGPERRLLESGKFKVAETQYDWSLNKR